MTGCLTSREPSFEWPRPAQPTLVPVDMEEVEGGFFISYTQATNLANNVDELKAYTEKLELLVEEMQEYYE